MRLLTVRLSEQDAARVAELRERGIKISSLVREAIAKQSAPRAGRMKKPGDVKKVLGEIYSRYPDPPGTRASTVDLTDRNSVARAIRRRLTRSKSA
ncbi:MAG: hypothetical protein ABSB42_13345 [Tepidisphaeraceae bacterium]|jgi:hypothetical protein